MRPFWLTATLILCSLPSWAQSQGENLVQIRPPEYQIITQDRQDQQIITEMVPTGESAANWTEKVETRIFLSTEATFPQFQQFIAQEWRETCPETRRLPGTEGEDNGYPFALWIQLCPQHARTGKPEYSWYKAIQGQDNFYVVRKAFRFEPSEKQINTWVHYLRSVRVCDPRRPESPCPKSK